MSDFYTNKNFVSFIVRYNNGMIVKDFYPIPSFFFKFIFEPISAIFIKIPIYIRLSAFIAILFFDLFLLYSKGVDFFNYLSIIVIIRVLILLFFILSVLGDYNKFVYYLTFSFTIYSIIFSIFSYFNYFNYIYANDTYSYFFLTVIFTLLVYGIIKGTFIYYRTSSFRIDYFPLFYRCDRLLYYLIIFIFTLYTSFLIFLYSGLINTDIESARYMISTLIQSEAAIIAIVITFTLVAVQYTASSYSTRVIDVFNLRNQDFWIVLITYILSMIYGLCILKLLRTSNYDAINPDYFYTLYQLNLHVHVILLYSFGIFAFISLIPYMLNIFSLFKPSEMIKILSENISLQNLKSTNENNEGENSNLEYFLPIFDILRSSLLKRDYEIVKCLQEFGKRILIVISNKDFTDDDLTKLLSLIFEEIKNIGLISFDKTNNQVTNELIRLIGNIGLIMVDNEKIDSTKQTILFLEEMGIIAKKKRMDFFVNKIIRILDDIKDKSKNMEIIQYISNSKKSISDPFNFFNY